MASTVEKIGRSMKKLITCGSRPVCQSPREGFATGCGVHRRAGLEALHAINHHHIAALEPLLYLPAAADARPICTSRCCALLSESTISDVVLALQLLDGALRQHDRIRQLRGRHLYPRELPRRVTDAPDCPTSRRIARVPVR